MELLGGQAGVFALLILIVHLLASAQMSNVLLDLFLDLLTTVCSEQGAQSGAETC